MSEPLIPELPRATQDGAAESILRLRALFPECVTEGPDGPAVDFDLLRQVLTPEQVVEGPAERYRIDWPGKRAALHEANAPTESVLRPIRERSKDFDATQNLYIEGDNLEALKLLRTAYSGKVKLIYIDPPYNTGHDFIYNDKYARSKAEEQQASGAVDAEGKKTEDKAPFQKNDETTGRYHSNWLSMMYPRLRLARDLLADDGVIFISIDDNEQANLKRLCDEIFGAENFVADFLWKKKSTTSNVSGAEVSSLVDHTLCFKRSSNAHLKPRVRESSTRTYPYHDEQGSYRLAVIEKKDAGEYRRDTMKFSILGHFPREGKRWQIGESKAREYEKNNRFLYDGEKIVLKIYSFEDKDTCSANPNLLEDCGTTDSASRMVNQELFGVPELFNNPKPVDLIKHLATLVIDKDDIVLDFFSGSATTAHAVMALNAEDGGKRKFIMVQLPAEVEMGNTAREAKFKDICEIGEERIRRVGEKILSERPELRGKLDVGFRVLRVDSGNFERAEALPREAVASRAAWLASLRTDVLKAGRTEEDLLFEALGRQRAVPFSAGFAQEELAGARVWSVAGGTLLACLEGAGRVTGEVVEAMARRRPVWAVFREGGFADDTAKANMVQRFRQLSPETETWVL